MNRFANIADWASVIGMVVSILGVCLTLWVALRVRRIEQHYVRQALLPNYLRKLGGQLKNLDRELRAKNRRQAVHILALCGSILQDLLPYVSGRRSHTTLEAIHKIDALRRSTTDATFVAQCEDLNADLKALLNSLKSFQEELQWRMRNGK